MTKAYEIKYNSVKSLLELALNELNAIINYRIKLGEVDELTEESDGIYEIEVEDDFSVEVDVMDTYSLDFYTEPRKVEAFVKYPDEDAVYVNIDGEEDPIALRALPFDSIVVLVDELENMRAELIKE